MVKHLKKIFMLAILGLVNLLSGCATGLPEGLEAVKGFEPERYLGRWYEIARLDHSFERGLDNVTADYSLNSDGSIAVLNRGYDRKNERWKEAKGIAIFLGDRTTASLKVSFFRPFWGGYHVLVLDKDYRYAMIAGPDRSYLWILCREKGLDRDILQGLVSKAKAWGFDTSKLEYIRHDS